ncbi:MAG: CCA tRNA nucleotidyltransferase [Candidatus Krumholzibacteriia bacterium]
MIPPAIPTVPLPRPLPAAAAAAVGVVRRLAAAGHQAYLVGGAVRDLLLGGEPGDFDVATSASPERILALFPEARPAGVAFPVVLVREQGCVVETATFRIEGPYGDARHPDSVDLTTSLPDDARRRDFTVNALYLDPLAGVIVDPVGGAADCARRVLRCVGEPGARFREDALRLLRAPRLAAQCGLTIDGDTRAALAADRAGIRRVAAERVGQELARMLTGPAPADALAELADSGLLALILPEADAMRGVPQPPQFHPEGDVWTHTLLMFRHSPARSLPLGLGVLLHDVAKPVTLTRTDRIRFHGHAARGAEMTLAIGRRLRYAAADVARAADLVAQHLRFIDVRNMRPSTLKRFLRQPGFAEHLELHRLDCLGSHRDLGQWEFCRAALARLPSEELAPPPLLRGADLLALGYPPGPLLGRILRELETAQLDGDLATRDAAEGWVRRRFPQRGNDATR